MQGVVNENATQRVRVEWSNARQSNPVHVGGINRRFHLELPDSFTGTEITYEVRNAAGDWIPLHDGGLVHQDTVAATTAALCLLDADALAGLTEFRILSDQAETCVGWLHCSA